MEYVGAVLGGAVSTRGLGLGGGLGPGKGRWSSILLSQDKRFLQPKSASLQPGGDMMLAMFGSLQLVLCLRGGEAGLGGSVVWVRGKRTKSAPKRARERMG